ncbi:MAG TPA: hypothetical protein VHM24_13290 [Gemmatimonadaceae bacterium]|nr:hypothetical protein [Gemmatimonadaceae bacterium]
MKKLLQGSLTFLDIDRSRAVAALSAIFTVSLSVACAEHPAAPLSGLEVREASNPSNITSTPVPLTEMAGIAYKGYTGGLYPPSSNTMPADHALEGIARGRAIIPRDLQGNPNRGGKYVLLTVGMSNARNEACTSVDGAATCDSWSFIGRADADPAVNHTSLVMINGAVGGLTAPAWDDPADKAYAIVRDRLTQRGLSENQVQVVWIKEANAQPALPLPSADADAFALERSLGAIVRTLKAVYPNLQQVFLSSRIYAGYATIDLNPEPYAYESGFSVKWLIRAQLNQRVNGVVDPVAGDLNYATVAPWIAWGPYLWANGATPRADGLRWEPQDFLADGTHPSRTGVQKVAGFLLTFFKTSPQTRCWFVAGGVCG